uniref:Uncharacterized protein n=1 Tax=viral metagenome TaxID=1070528 RepID=A0A6M3IQY9_9ZZZZ
MGRTIKMGGSISGVIATGSYQNLRPGFTWEETVDDSNMTDEEIGNRIAEMYCKCFTMLKEAEQKAIVERIQRERKDLRFMISPAGNILPSVTSIINYDIDFFVSPEELSQYCSQGNIIDVKVKHYINTGEWVEGKTINDCWTDIVILTKGNLKLEIDAGDFPGFLKKYPISDMKVGERFYYDEEGYCGEPDFIGVPDFKEAESIPTIFDVKRTPSKVKNGMQLAAYAKKHNITQGIIVPLNDKTGQGFSKPIVYTKDELDGYYKIFKNKQKAFKQRYNI